jgi:hypothetical protein
MLHGSRFFAVMSLCAALLGSAAQAQVMIAGLAEGRDAVSPDAIRKIEQRLMMPDGAAKLTDYVRFYAPGQLQDRKLVVGVFVQKSKLQLARNADAATAVDGLNDVFLTSVGKLPKMSAGGCDMVTTYFDVGKQQFMLLQESGRDALEARCNSQRGS